MIEPIIAASRDKMRKAIEVTKNDLSSIRSGRATPALVEHMIVSVYGGTQRLKMMELATITTQDARTLLIAPYDPSIIAEIEKGIMEANVGLTPAVDGELIRISIPPLSQERRVEYVKLVRTKLEGGRVMVRQVRQEAMKSVKQLVDAKTISEDQQKHAERLIQELTDEIIAELDGMGERKETELLQI